MKQICPICVVISSAWLVLSAGIAWALIPPEPFLVLISLLMGGTVVGIAYMGERKCSWAEAHQQLWKTLCIGSGFILSYIFLTNLTKLTVIIELITLIIIAYFFFFREPSAKTNNKALIKLEKEMEQCC